MSEAMPSDHTGDGGGDPELILGKSICVAPEDIAVMALDDAHVPAPADLPSDTTSPATGNSTPGEGSPANAGTHLKQDDPQHTGDGSRLLAPAAEGAGAAAGRRTLAAGESPTGLGISSSSGSTPVSTPRRTQAALASLKDPSNDYSPRPMEPNSRSVAMIAAEGAHSPRIESLDGNAGDDTFEAAALDPMCALFQELDEGTGAIGKQEMLQALSRVLGRRDITELDMARMLKNSKAASLSQGGLEGIDKNRFVEIMGDVDVSSMVAKSCVKEWLKQVQVFDILTETFAEHTTKDSGGVAAKMCDVSSHEAMEILAPSSNVPSSPFRKLHTRVGAACKTLTRRLPTQNLQ